MASKLSLEAYAGANPARTGGKPCWACSLPQAEEINQARRNGRTIATILDWLVRECGRTDATPGKLQAHFTNSRHHERG